MLLQFKRIDPIAIIPTVHRDNCSFEFVPIDNARIHHSGILETGLSCIVPNGYTFLSVGSNCFLNILLLPLDNTKFLKVQLQVVNTHDSTLYIRKGESIGSTWLVNIICPDIQKV